MRVERDMRMRLVAHLQTLHFAFHDRAQTGQLMAYANTDIQQINNVVLLIPLTIASTIQMVAVAVILFAAEPGARVLRARPRCRCSTSRRPGSATACSRSASRQQQELSDLSGVVEESVTGVRVVKGFGAERLQRERLRGRGRQRLRPLDRAGRACAPTSCPRSTCCPRSGSSASSGTAGIRCSTATSASATIVAANLYVLMLIWPLRMVGMLLAQLPRSAAAAGRINDVLITDPAIEDVPARPAAARRSG